MADKIYYNYESSGAAKRLKDLNDGAHAEQSFDATGLAGVRVTTTTAPQTGVWTAIHILEDANFSLLTDTSATGDAMTGFVIPAGTLLRGKFTAYTLASGKVRAYV